MKRQRWPHQKGSQLLELSFALPFLLLLVVGAWDFGSAFLLKQKLTNAAREGARIVISSSLTNAISCTNSVPCPVSAAEKAVVHYLSNAGLDASCLDSVNPTTTYVIGPPATGVPTWTWTCKGVPTSLTINRWGAAAGADTAVSLTYPVRWSLLNFFGVTVVPTKISTQVIMPNLTY